MIDDLAPERDILATGLGSAGHPVTDAVRRIADTYGAWHHLAKPCDPEQTLRAVSAAREKTEAPRHGC